LRLIRSFGCGFSRAVAGVDELQSAAADGLKERFSQYDHHLDSFVLDEDLPQQAFEKDV
jgi:hypothetical protein